MDERLWLTGTDPLALLADLYPLSTLGSERPQTRQSRMYLLACARRAWARLPGVCRAMVALAEVYADSPTEKEWLREDVAPIAEQLMHSSGEESDLLAAETELSVLSVWDSLSPSDMLVRLKRREKHTGTSVVPDPPLGRGEWQALARLVYLPFVRNTPAYSWVTRSLHSIRLLREVCGNPCRFTPFPPAWRTSDAVAIARHMHESREFSAMPILADALQDAGCTSDAILDHCRAPREHVRGCWVVDLVLNLK